MKNKEMEKLMIQTLAALQNVTHRLEQLELTKSNDNTDLMSLRKAIADMGGDPLNPGALVAEFNRLRDMEMDCTDEMIFVTLIHDHVTNPNLYNKENLMRLADICTDYFKIDHK